MTTNEQKIVREVIEDWKTPDSPEAFAASMYALERALRRSEKKRKKMKINVDTKKEVG